MNKLWPALIIGAIAAVILFVGLALVMTGEPVLDNFMKWCQGIGNAISEFFNPTPTI